MTFWLSHSPSQASRADTPSVLETVGYIPSGDIWSYSEGRMSVRNIYRNSDDPWPIPLVRRSDAEAMIASLWAEIAEQQTLIAGLPHTAALEALERNNDKIAALRLAEMAVRADAEAARSRVEIAVRDERERCALIVEEWGFHSGDGIACSSTIREGDES